MKMLIRKHKCKRSIMTIFYKNQIANYDDINDAIFSNVGIGTNSEELKKKDVMVELIK